MLLYFRVLLVAALLFPPALAGAEETVYYVNHTAVLQDQDGDRNQQTGFIAVDRQGAARRGQAITLRPLWIEKRVSNWGRALTSDLDPSHAGDRRMLEGMAHGLAMTVAADGGLGAPRMRNVPAWNALIAHEPRMAREQLGNEQLLVLRPLVLPAALTAGQTMTLKHATALYGPLATTLKVITVTPTVALVDVELQAKGLLGSGRQAIRRTDGHVIEAHLMLERQAQDDAPAAEHAVHVADMAYEAMVDMFPDADSYLDYLANVDAQLEQPPFSSISPDASRYALSVTGRGELADWMVDESHVATVEGATSFGMLAVAAPRKMIALSAHPALAPPGGPGVNPGTRAVAVHLRRVEVLDRAGRVMDHLAPQQVLWKFMLGERYQVAENQAAFPFRMPLTATAEDLARIDAVRMTVDAEVYRWDSAERVAVGAVSAVNPGAQLRWSAPHRVALAQARPARGQREGLWSTLVPLDAQGREMPSLQMSVGPHAAPFVPKNGGAPMLPLGWEQAHDPIRIEVAAAAPVAAVELRHYRWKLVPRTWLFPNGVPKE